MLLLRPLRPHPNCGVATSYRHQTVTIVTEQQFLSDCWAASDRPAAPRRGQNRAVDTIAVLLAAGGGTRFAGPRHKLATPLGDGRTVAEHALAAARAAAIGPVIVVVGATALDLPAAAAEGVTFVTNPDWQQGQATSLQVAIATADRRGAEAIVVGLADQPLVAVAAWRRIAASRAPIAIATYPDAGPGPGHPVRLHRSVWPLVPTDGDRGARDLIRSRPELVERVPCEGSTADVDTIADLDQVEELGSWQSSSSTNSR